MKHSCSNTLVYTFASLTVEHCVIFWNMSSGEKYAKTVKNLVFITSCKDFCLLTTKLDDGSGQVRVVWYFLLVVKLWFSNHYNLYIALTCVASQIVCGCLKGTATVYKSHVPSAVSFKPGYNVHPCILGYMRIAGQLSQWFLLDLKAVKQLAGTIQAIWHKSSVPWVSIKGVWDLYRRAVASLPSGFALREDIQPPSVQIPYTYSGRVLSTGGRGGDSPPKLNLTKAYNVLTQNLSATIRTSVRYLHVHVLVHDCM